MKNILFIITDSYTKKLNSVIKEYSGCNLFAFNISDNFCDDNNADKLNLINILSYLNYSDLTIIDKTALNISKKWYIENNLDISEYEGISLGKIVQYEIMEYFVGAIKSLTFINKIIEIEKIDKIILFGNNNIYEKAAIIFGKQSKCIVENHFIHTSKSKSPQNNIKISLFAKYLIIIFHNIIRKIRFRKIQPKKHILVTFSKRLTSLTNDINKCTNYLISLIITSSFPNISDLKKNISLRKVFNIFNQTDSSELSIAKTIFNNSKQNIEKEILKSEVEYLPDYINNDIEAYFINNKKKVISYIDNMGQYIKNSKIDIIIVNQDFRDLPRVVVEIGNKESIPTIVMQHGAYGHFPYFVSPVSKFIGVWGEKWKNWFLRDLGIEERRLVITGEPFYDEYLQNKNKEFRSIFLNKHNISVEKKIILYAFSNSLDISATNYEMLNENLAYKVLKILSKFDDYHIIFKMHHGNNHLMNWESILRNTGARNVTVINKTNNLELLKSADLIITRSSTMAFEGIILDKPVVIMNFPLKVPPAYNPFADSKATILVEKEEDLAETIKNAFEDPETLKNLRNGRKLFRQKFFINDNSFNRTLNALNKIIN